MSLSGSRTEKNLLKTFSGEARTLTKYSLFAEKAMEEGYTDVAEDFIEIAKEEFAHAREAFKRYLKLVKSTSENLKNSINNEMEDSNTLYRRYEKEAMEEGFEDIANFFRQLIKVEKEHSDIFKELSSMVENDKNNMKKRTYKCLNCGNIFVSKEAHESCSLCKYPNNYAVEIEENDVYEFENSRNPKRRRRRRPYSPYNFNWWYPYFYYHNYPYWYNGGYKREK